MLLPALRYWPRGECVQASTSCLSSVQGWQLAPRVQILTTRRGVRAGINILFVIARVLNLMHFQPRLGVVTRSLLLAGPDLLHFTLVAGIVFVGYAMMAHVIFGNVIQKFSTFRLSIDTCFEMLLGEIGVNEELTALTGLQVCL